MRYGYYDARNYKMCRYVDPIVDTFADMLGKLSGFMFAPPDQQPAAIEAYIETAKKYHKIVESNLVHHGGRFAAGNKVTIADFVMASHIGNYIENANFPLA